MTKARLTESIGERRSNACLHSKVKEISFLKSRISIRSSFLILSLLTTAGRNVFDEMG